MSLCYGCTNKSYNVANGQFYHQIYRGVMHIKSSQISMVSNGPEVWMIFPEYLDPGVSYTIL